ncbi:hypothetical protein FOQG_14458 [Fusarium oxysporum f. sp. raphani 54005]|uniref:Uncharacterized protein n=2 Tax=Fusarium oxysporum TaxID=5507 RepID=X0BQ32_FUSOX|nr:hypothetical protein FOVG_14733 [Fusarium oxysporum f. sp. pisi HDV247]EXK81028.1 hypothetical protein FOQG_14458 [Fusarium oxysporum f. sp. raphani 54005]
MSLKTTTTTPSRQWNGEEDALRDYRLHLTGQRVEQEYVEPSHENDTGSAQSVDTPANWPTQYRRIPPYRPINRNLDLSERPNGSSRAELVFVTVMLNGVRLQSGLVRAWECTGGHWYPQLTRYKIGGEW